MRRLFLVLAKLFGLLQIYWALIYFVHLGTMMSMFVQGASFSVLQTVLNIAGITIYMTLSAGMAWLLIAKTDWLADKLKIGSETEQSADLREDVILRCGVKLIGLFIAVYAIPAVVKVLLRSGIFGIFDYGITDPAFSMRAWSFLDEVSPPALQLALGLFLALKSTKVVEMMTKQSKPVIE